MRIATGRRWSGEALAWLVLAAVGMGVLGASFGYGVLVEEGRVGPGFLPMLAGGVLAALSVVLLVRTTRAGGATPEEGDGVDRFGRTRRQRARMLWLVFGLLVGAALLTSLVGFLVSFGLLVLAISAGIERRRILPSLLVSVAATALVHLVFVVVLGVPLPGGLLGLGAGA